MANSGVISTSRATGKKTASFFFLTSAVAGVYSQNSFYDARYAGTQSGWSGTSPSTALTDRPSSPYNGHIVALCVSIRVSANPNNYYTKLMVAIAPGKKVGYVPLNTRIQQAGFIKFDRSKAELIQCRIPIKKGEQFCPQIHTPAWGALNLSFQSDIYVIIESDEPDEEDGVLTETQSVYHSWSAGGIAFNDNTFRQIPSWQWGSGPAENAYATTGYSRSRLTGNIKGFSIGSQATPPVSQEEFTLEVHLENAPQRQTQGSSLGNMTIIPVGKFSLYGSANCANGFIPCNIPIRRNQGFYLVARSPTLANNPTSFQICATAIIEGTSEGNRGSMNGKRRFGSKNADFFLGNTGNLIMSNNTIYYAPWPIYGGSNWSTSLANVSGQVSPYDGIICESTFSVISVTAFNSREEVEYGYAFLNERGEVTSYNPAANIRMVQYNPPSGAWSILYKHNIPIKKGQRFVPYMRTQTFTSVGTMRFFCAVHIRGN